MRDIVTWLMGGLRGLSESEALIVTSCNLQKDRKVRSYCDKIHFYLFEAYYTHSMHWLAWPLVNKQIQQFHLETARTGKSQQQRISDVSNP